MTLLTYQVFKTVADIGSFHKAADISNQYCCKSTALMLADGFPWHTPSLPDKYRLPCHHFPLLHKSHRPDSVQRNNYIIFLSKKKEISIPYSPENLTFSMFSIKICLVSIYISLIRSTVMSFSFLNQLPSPEEIKRDYPLSPELTALKRQRDASISDVITGKDSRFLVIIGPCSADNEDSVCDYVSRLTRIQEDVKDQIIIIPRIYTNKPRTTGEGYKGIASQPDPEKAPDMVEGLIAMRKMHIRAIAESGLTCADEMLYPENWGYVEDLLSYVAIGARSVEDQQHRLTVSGFDVASGMKNPTSGDFSVMLNSVYAAQHPHHFVYRGYEVETTGNPLTHVVLRGAVSKHGNTTTNYHYEDLIRLHEMYGKMDVVNPAAIIDTNHSNSGKKFKEQIRIAKEVMHNRQLSSDIRSLVKGLMIESYIEEGCQSIGDHVYGKSITDPCLGWEDSKKLIYDIAEMNAR